MFLYHINSFKNNSEYYICLFIKKKMSHFEKILFVHFIIHKLYINYYVFSEIF